MSWAKRLGYKIVFDVIEDFGLSKDVSSTLYLYAKSSLTHRISSRMNELSSGFVAISSYLERKCAELSRGRAPVHYLPISVDMSLFPEKAFRMNGTVSLLYAGSFGRKDGLPVLLDAFDSLAGKYANIRLVLSGRGYRGDMKEFVARMELSPHKERIEFKGYLEEKDYYFLLNDIDIPCMTPRRPRFCPCGLPVQAG